MQYTRPSPNMLHSYRLSWLYYIFFCANFEWEKLLSDLSRSMLLRVALLPPLLLAWIFDIV